MTQIVKQLALLIVVLTAACGVEVVNFGTVGGVDGGTQHAPMPVACGNPLDMKGCACDSPGATRPCYTGPSGSLNLGTCKGGQQTCVATGETLVTWSACTGDVLPTAEDCVNNLDTNCNGLTGCDELECAGVSGCCTPGEDRPCYGGPAGTDGVGICHGGINVCNAQGAWDPACVGEVKPGLEVGHCSDGLDNDCNGLTDCVDWVCLFDNACIPPACTAGATKTCYSGPSGTEGVGICKSGTATCNSSGSGWGPCVGEVTPAVETAHCTDHIDNDCDGKIDCADSSCSSDIACCTPDPGIDSTIYATSAYTLYTINPTTWAETAIGDYNAPGGDKMTDLAMTPNGNVYTVSGTALYQINKVTGQATKVVTLGGTLNNGLTFLADNTLLASDAGGVLKHVDPSNGNITIIGTYCGGATCGAGYGLGSSGDIVAVSSGTTYGVSATDTAGNDASSNNLLVKINTATGKATVVGPIGFANVFGLAYHGGMVLGFDYLGDIIQIDPTTGAGTKLSTQTGTHFFGGTTSPLVPPMGCP